MLIRPLSGKKIWEILIKNDTIVSIEDSIIYDDKTVCDIYRIAQDFAYNTFLDMKSKYELKIDDHYRKYKYAIEIRREVASKIGLDNIRLSRLKKLEKEMTQIKEKYQKKKKIVPVFKPIFMARLVK